MHAILTCMKFSKMAVVVNQHHGFKAFTRSQRCRLQSFTHLENTMFELSQTNLAHSLKQAFEVANIHKSFSTPCLSLATNSEEDFDASPRIEIIGGRGASSVRALVAEVAIAMASGADPVRASTGLGGAYFLDGQKGNTIAVAKPVDEEPLALNNPKGFVVAALASSLSPLFRSSVRVLVLCTIFLKQAVAAGLCLADIGEMMTRESCSAEQKLSVLENLCTEAKASLRNIFGYDDDVNHNSTDENDNGTDTTQNDGGSNEDESRDGRKVGGFMKSMSFSVQNRNHETGGISFGEMSEVEWKLFLECFEKLLPQAFEDTKNMGLRQRLGTSCSHTPTPTPSLGPQIMIKICLKATKIISCDQLKPLKIKFIILRLVSF
ncbi:unnamed protein product, partial [Vitis vinifera]